MVCQTKPEIDKKVAQTAVDFFENLVQLEGQWAGQKLKLSPWQDKIAGFPLVPPSGSPGSSLHCPPHELQHVVRHCNPV